MVLTKPHRRLLHTTNMLERQSKEIKRRTLVATLFPNTDFSLRLIDVVLMAAFEDCDAGHRYQTMYYQTTKKMTEFAEIFLFY